MGKGIPRFVIYCLTLQCVASLKNNYLTAAKRSLDPPWVNATIIDKQYVLVSWRREGSWSTEESFTIDFRATGSRPTQNPCTGQLVPCRDDNCSLNSKERCQAFGVCRDVGVVITGNGHSSDTLDIRTDAYTPASVNVESNGGLLNVSWQGPANKDGDCYTGSVLTISTPWTEYSASFTEILDQYQHSHNLTGCDVGNVTASLRSFDLMGNSATVTNSTEYLGEDASPVIDDLNVTPGPRNVSVTWSLLGNCTKVTSYQLTWTPSDAGGQMTVFSSFANITGLSPCQEYLLTVQPLEGADNFGEPGNETIITENEEPQQPTDVQVLTVESKWDQLNLTWTQPPPPGPLCPITTNRISWSRADTGGSAGEEEIAAGSSYTITDLDPCAQYSVTIRAATEKGYGDGSEGNVGNTGTVVPEAPAKVTALPVETNSAHLYVTWTQPPPPGPLCPITTNRISWSRADTGGSAGEEEIAASSSYLITGLDPCSPYSVIVKAANGKGYGDPYGESAGNTYGEPPQAPSDIEVTMVENLSDHLHVTWIQPAPPGPMCPITNNSIKWFLANTGDTVGADEIIASSEYSITGLEAYTNYSVHIASKTDYGFGQEASASNTTDQDIPGSPIIDSLEVVTPSSLLVKWQPPRQPNGVITGYKIGWTCEIQNLTEYLDNNQYRYEITNLTACVPHEITVMAETIKGFGEGSTNYTTMAVAPEAPENVSALKVPNISDQIKVTWTQPKPSGNCTITSNKVKWTWQNQGRYENETVISTTTSYTISGLKPYTNYTVCAAAQTEGGYGAYGDCDSAVTEEDVPGPPVIQEVDFSSDSISLAWEPPPEPNGVLLLYNLSWVNVADVSDGGMEILPSTQNSYSIIGLRSNSQYNISLMAKTSAGWGTVLSGVTETKPTMTWLTWLTLGFITVAVVAVIIVTLHILYRCILFHGNSGSLRNDKKSDSNLLHEKEMGCQNFSYTGRHDDYVPETYEVSQHSNDIISPESVFSDDEMEGATDRANSLERQLLRSSMQDGIDRTDYNTTNGNGVNVISSESITHLSQDEITSASTLSFSPSRQDNSSMTEEELEEEEKEEELEEEKEEELEEDEEEEELEEKEEELKEELEEKEEELEEEKEKKLEEEKEKELEEEKEEELEEEKKEELEEKEEELEEELEEKEEELEEKEEELEEEKEKELEEEKEKELEEEKEEELEKAIHIHNDESTDGIETFDVIKNTVMPVTSFRHNGVEKTEINDDHVNHQVKAANCKTSKNELSCKNTNTDKTVSPNSKLSQNGIEKKEHNGVHMDNKVESAGCKADRTTLPCLEKNTGKIVSSGSPLEQDVERRENNAVHDGRKASKNTLPRREEKTGPVMNNPFERTDNVDVTLTAESANGKQNGAPPVNPKKNGESVYSSHIQSVHNVIERTENRKSVLDIENMEDIHKAARQGDAEEVLKVLEKGEDPSAVTSANNTPLHYAAYEGHIEVAKLLMDKKSDPNLSNKSGNTSLHLAALNGKTEVAKLLCGWEGLDVNNPGATNETLLAYARYGEEKPMLVVLKNPDTISPEGNTPLHCASLAGQTEVVKLLLMNDADVKNKTPTHHTALHYAALRNEVILVKLLLDYGADPNVKDNQNNTPLHYAALCGHTSVIELLVEERADINIRTDRGLSVLHKASLHGRLSTVQKLVELEDTLVITRDKEKLSAEDTALIRGHVHTAWWLNKKAIDSLQDLKHLMNICMRQYKKSGDFYHAYCREKNASAEALATAVDFGVCDMHYQDERGRTLLHVAAEQGDRPKIGVLLERGALPTARTHDGKTPSDLAREKGHLEAAKAIADEVKVEETDCEKNKLYIRLLNLISEAAKYDVQGDNEEQAARLAAVKEASSLLASGAPLEPPEGHSCYPLHLAIATNCTPLLPLLLAAGAPMTSSSDGFGPVQLAWMTPDVTTWVGVVVTRAVIHKILMEMSLLDADLQLFAEYLVNSLEGKKPWDAKVSIPENSAITLDSLLFRACANGATTFAWWIWHSGGSAVSQNKDKRTPLHAALDSGHLDTAISLVLHMGANLFLRDNKGRAPINLIPDEVSRRQVLKASLGREYQRLADESEKAREPAQKQEVKQFILLLLSLYSEDMDTHNGTLCWKAVFGWLNDELSESKDSDDVTYNDRLEFIIEKRAKHSASNVVMSNRERNMPLNTFSKIIEKALVLSCEKEFPLFLHLLVQVGGQKVDQELEVCRASPLHYAALKNNASAARYLVSHGASVEAKDRFGNTPAHYACMYGYKDLGDFLRTGQVNRCGLTAIDLLDGYKNYLKLYELDSESLLDIDMQKTNTGPQRTEALLNELKKKWQSDGIEKSVAKVHVNYTRGESHVIKDAVFNLVKSVQNSVANKNTVFSGELLMLGSSADNVRLFCPDEFDYNIVLSNLHGFGNGDLQVSLQEVGLSYTGCRTKINVSSNNQVIIPLLKGSNFLHIFYNLVKECITNFEPEDERIAIIPPGIKKTQVGVGLSLAWTGKEFPLLLVDVDIVPTMEAPWPADLPRPPLTPPHLKSVYINSIGNGEWRFSFAKAENEIMKNLTDDQRQVFLACKMVLSCLKVEKWAPREIQNRFKYFDKIFSKIPSPKGFVLKNTFFLELQEFKNNSYYWTDHSSKRIRTVFKRMCEKDTEEASKIEAYFAGGTQASCLGHGASEVVKFFTPKPGFHGVSVHRL